MTNDPVFQRFREISWQRALTAAEQAELNAWLEANPEFRAEWEAEWSLSSSLAHLPNPAVPSNFTARVMQNIEREALAENRSRTSNGWWQHLARKTRWVMGTSSAALLVVAGLVIHSHQVQKQREQALARNFVIFSKLSAPTDVLENFDTIRALSAAPPPDDQLLALLE